MFARPLPSYQSESSVPALSQFAIVLVVDQPRGLWDCDVAKQKHGRSGRDYTVLLHNAQEFDNDLRAGSNEDLALASLLGVVDGVEGIVQDTGFDHCGDGRLYEL